MTGLHKFVHEYNYEDLPEILDTVLIDFTVHKPMDTKTCKTKYFPLFEDVYFIIIFNIDKSIDKFI